jgi:hypothetical protein
LHLLPLLPSSLWSHTCFTAAAAAALPLPPLHIHAGLHAFPFHVLSVALHALVSMLVLALAQHLFAKLEVAAGWASPQADSTSSVATAAAAGLHTSSSSSSVMSRLLMWQQQPELWLRPVTWAGQVQALMAVALFALHPVHTEVRSQHSVCLMSRGHALCGCSSQPSGCSNHTT